VRLFAPHAFTTSYVACHAPLFKAVVGMTHSIAEASQSRIVSPRNSRSVEPSRAEVAVERARQFWGV
jgi:hypothetical protein